MASLYVHVPFCPTLCPYCDFHVVRRGPGWVEAYLRRLAEEAQALHEGFPKPLRTLYLGGGTPSYLRDRELVALFQSLPWALAEGAEVTLEANPGTLSPGRLRLLKDLGVNRLSLGVQSFQEGVLKFLGRAHGRKGALKAVEMALEGGFRVSIDLILGLPMQDVEADLKEAARLGVGHVSAYTLQVEKGTPFALLGLREDPEREAWAMERAEEVLGEAGLLRYEVSNFAREGEEARHNLVYWRAGFWLALGPRATGQYPGKGGAYALRRTAPPLPRWLLGEAPEEEAISPLEHAKESLMLGLRLREGVEVGAVEKRTGLTLFPLLQGRAMELAQEGLLQVRGKRLLPTPKAFPLLHRVVLELWEALAPLAPDQGG
ncbi:oxygen-independent coproporphyrinogen III oxidase [Thermus thermophilus]|uniref:radical SAM family heme chaperone HemW n=1 Tax=Thermus thermophilus TaxID=274 RepID=UPI00090970B7|nr:radical SAM family heme chaperone HemW [Thermus thermophilus]BAW01349.1 oxygen-independent coproporphyrinogen III oxidase [Thermus thermophilus]BDB11987.1 coproporphyrinogen III oxidase [Thermus thermophilus]